MTSTAHAILVNCDRAGDGYRCEVQVGDDAAATHHEVTFQRDELEQLAPDATPDELVRAAVGYLLEHEPRESILRQFELDVIGRYFPGWQDAVRARVGS